MLVGSPFTVVAENTAATGVKTNRDPSSFCRGRVETAAGDVDGRRRDALGGVVVGKTCSRSFFVLSWSRLNRGRVWTGGDAMIWMSLASVDDDATRRIQI